jgi:hypothetical protein
MLPCITQAQDKSSKEKAGDIMQILIPVTAYATTFALNDKEGRIQFYKSFFTNIAVTHILKHTVNKKRQENNGNYSFPSGHTSAAFQGATFIHRRYGLKYGIPAYAAAVYVGWSRIEGESDKHDYVDVSAGAAIGILSSYYFTERYKGLEITPVAGNHFLGCNLSKSW